MAEVANDLFFDVPPNFTTYADASQAVDATGGSRVSATITVQAENKSGGDAWLALQGSNDGTSWVTLGTTVAPVEEKVSGAGTKYNLNADVDGFAWVRVQWSFRDNAVPSSPAAGDSLILTASLNVGA